MVQRHGGKRATLLGLSPASLMWLALSVGGVLASRGQLWLGEPPERQPLLLSQPATAVEELSQLGPSQLGYFAWVAGETLTLRFSRLQAGDLVQIKALAEPRSCVLAAELDGRLVGSFRLAGSFREVQLVLPKAGEKLRLRRVGDSCTVHFSRIKRQGFLGTTGPGVGEAYLLSPQKQLPAPVPWGSVLLPPGSAAAAAALLSLLSRRRLLWPPGLAALGVSGGAMVCAAAAAWVARVRVVYPQTTLWLFWLAPQGAWALGIAWSRRRELGQLATRILGVLGRWWQRVRQAALGPAPVELSAAAALLAALYGAWLLASLPATPFEWDEYLFAQGVERFDVARHAPHPPGYPVYIAVAKLFFVAGVPAVHATQLASLLGALLELAGFFQLLAAAGVGDGRLWAVVGAAGLPCVVFAANLGLSDMLAAGLGACSLVWLWRLQERGGRREALVFGTVAALALGARPQVALLLLLPAASAAVRLLRQGNFRFAWAVLAGGATSAGVWLPAVLATGWKRYWAATQHLANWMQQYEALSRFPLMPVSRFLEDWLVRPLGHPVLALAFWLAVLGGTVGLWRAKKGRLAAFLWAAGGGYLLLAPWAMTAEACVRYSLPGFLVLAGLLAGWEVFGAGLLRLLPGAVLGVAGLLWSLPALTLRAGEPNPAWQALSWVAERLPAGEVAVLEGLRPHGEWLLRGSGHRVGFVAEPQQARGARVLVGQGNMPPARRVLFRAFWPSEPTGSLTRRRYLQAWVIEP
jgi:hypothetical protein